MDWNNLRHFLAIAETGSLSGAAQQLNVNHSTMFRRLQTLEQDMGGRLFDKINNRYVLTPLGEEIREHARQISDTVDRIDRQIVGRDFQPRGVVKITAPFNIANRYLPEILSEFRVQYPEIEINVLSSNIEFNLNHRQADIALRATAKPPEYLIGHRLCALPWYVYASPSYLAQHGRPLGLPELSGHRLIGACGSMLNLKAFIWLEQNLSAQIRTRCDELTAIARFIAEGHGIGLLPVDQAMSGLEALFPFEHGGESDLWLLTHPDLRAVERIRLVMQVLRQGFGSLPQV